MSKIVLRGRKVNGGSAEGEALVTKESLGGFGCFDFDTGKVIDFGHELFGKNVSGKILVFKTGKGWSAGRLPIRLFGLSGTLRRPMLPKNATPKPSWVQWLHVCQP